MFSSLVGLPRFFFYLFLLCQFGQSIVHFPTMTPLSFSQVSRRLKLEIQGWFREFLVLERERWEAEEGPSWAERVGALDMVALVLVEFVRHRVLAHSASILIAMELEVDKFLYGWPGLVNDYCEMVVEDFRGRLWELVQDKVAFKGLEDDVGQGSKFLVELQEMVGVFRLRLAGCVDEVIDLVSDDGEAAVADGGLVDVGDVLVEWVESQELVMEDVGGGESVEAADEHWDTWERELGEEVEDSQL